ncbi:MAG: response regulator transcription factor [Chloroflexi bacterium]|nr:response regulator transcription factor [Chloroflexota bacterium]
MHGRVGGPPTAQELAVLRLLVLGLANKLIAHQLGVTEQTVKAHVTVLLRK